MRVRKFDGFFCHLFLWTSLTALHGAATTTVKCCYCFLFLRHRAEAYSRKNNGWIKRRSGVRRTTKETGLCTLLFGNAFLNQHTKETRQRFALNTPNKPVQIPNHLKWQVAFGSGESIVDFSTSQEVEFMSTPRVSRARGVLLKTFTPFRYDAD